MNPQSQVRMYCNLVPLTMREIPTNQTDASVFLLDQTESQTPITIALTPCQNGVFADISRDSQPLGKLQFTDGVVLVINANNQTVDSFPLGVLTLTRDDLMLKVLPHPGELLVPRVSAAMIGATILAYQRQHAVMSA